MLDTAARSAGLVLGGAFAVVARARATVRPLHPRGEVCSGTLTRHGCPRPTGVAWLDEPGTDPVTVRLSDSAGLPRPLPDVRGLALRVPVGPAKVADLLLGSTGTRPLARHVLVVTSAARPPMTSQVPFRSARGPILLGAFPQPDAPAGPEGGLDAGFDDAGPRGSETGTESFALGCAGLRGRWQHFATLTIPGAAVRPGADDPSLRFDPVGNTVPGLPNYAWVERLRGPAYAAARHASPSAR